MAPNPSTVPMRVRAVTMGSGAPLRIRNFDWSTLGKFSGQESRGTSRIGVENCSSRCSSQAPMAGNRFFVRGETYTPFSSNPPWQWITVDDQGLDDVVVRQQLFFGELGLQCRHQGSPWAGWPDAATRQCRSGRHGGGH